MRQWSRSLIGNLKFGYLLYGLEMDSSFVIFTLKCFQNQVILNCIYLSMYFGALAQEYQVVCFEIAIFLYLFLFSLILNSEYTLWN